MEASPTKSAKKKATKPKKTGPSVGELIVKAVSASKERSGVSASALKKALAAGGYDVDKNRARVKTAIKSLVLKGTLLQTKGVGASGSFKINKKADTKPKKPARKPAAAAAPKAKKPAAKKPAKAAAAKKTKAAAAKKPAAASKSPKKVKKPAAAKKPKAKTPKKPTKSPKKAAKSPKKAAKSPKKATKSPKKPTKSPKKAPAAAAKKAPLKKTAAKKK
uniref:H15 domain-containing protein n=1 Tax=Anabas testudineus TaxID=64144 RepID=A0A7N6B9A2_ANATE